MARRRKNPGFAAIQAGDRVTIVNRFGQQATGRAVMLGPAGWVLNMGGPHGTPGIASPENVVKVVHTKASRDPRRQAMARWMGSRGNPPRRALPRRKPVVRASRKANPLSKREMHQAMDWIGHRQRDVSGHGPMDAQYLQGRVDGMADVAHAFRPYEGALDPRGPAARRSWRRGNPKQKAGATDTLSPERRAWLGAFEQRVRALPGTKTGTPMWLFAHAALARGMTPPAAAAAYQAQTFGVRITRKKNPLTKTETRAVRSEAASHLLQARYHGRGGQRYTSPQAAYHRGIGRGMTKVAATFGVKRRGNPNGVDDPAADELELYLWNDADLYRQHLTPIHRNLITKMARGTYDTKLAPKLFAYVVEAAAKKYVKAFDAPGAVWHQVFPPATRAAVAQSLTQTFEGEAALGNYDRLAPAKYQAKLQTQRRARAATAPHGPMRTNPRVVTAGGVVKRASGRVLVTHKSGKPGRQIQAEVYQYGRKVAGAKGTHALVHDVALAPVGSVRSNPRQAPVVPAALKAGGIRVQYLPANQAWMVLWNNQRLLGPVPRAEVEAYLRDVAQGRVPNPLSRREVVQGHRVIDQARESERWARSKAVKGFYRGYAGGTHDAITRWGGRGTHPERRGNPGVELRRDGKVVSTHPTVNAALEALHRRVSYSWSHAFTHEGWTITQNGRVVEPHRKNPRKIPRRVSQKARRRPNRVAACSGRVRLSPTSRQHVTMRWPTGAFRDLRAAVQSAGPDLRRALRGRRACVTKAEYRVDGTVGRWYFWAR